MLRNHRSIFCGSLSQILCKPCNALVLLADHGPLWELVFREQLGKPWRASLCRSSLVWNTVSTIKVQYIGPQLEQVAFNHLCTSHFILLQYLLY